MVDKVIECWSEITHKEGLHDQEEAFSRELIGKAIKSEKILEVGVGNGRMQRILIANGCNKETLYGIDLTDQVYNSEGNKKVGDARDLPYEDDTFDLVYSLGVVEHFPETEKAISEHFRVVKPNGMVVITTPHFSPETFFRVFSYYKTGRYRDGTFMETKGKNYKLKDICNLVTKNTSNIILKAGVSGPVIRMIRGRFSFIYNIFLKRLESRIGSYLYIVATKEAKNNSKIERVG